MNDGIVTVIDKFEFVRKMNDFLNSLGYETGSDTGDRKEPLKSPDGISVIFDEKGFFNRLAGSKMIHCFISWPTSQAITMLVPGRGINGEHLEEMRKLASRISDQFNRNVTVELVSEDFEYELNTLCGLRM